MRASTSGVLAREPDRWSRFQHCAAIAAQCRRVFPGSGSASTSLGCDRTDRSARRSSVQMDDPDIIPACIAEPVLARRKLPLGPCVEAILHVRRDRAGTQGSPSESVGCRAVVLVLHGHGQLRGGGISEPGAETRAKRRIRANRRKPARVKVACRTASRPLRYATVAWLAR